MLVNFRLSKESNDSPGNASSFLLAVGACRDFTTTEYCDDPREFVVDA